MTAVPSIVTLTKVSGQDQRLLPVGYWLRGSLMEEITVGKSLLIHRHSRMGIRKGEAPVMLTDGVFISSKVIAIEGDLVRTENSVWRLLRGG